MDVLNECILMGIKKKRYSKYLDGSHDSIVALLAGVAQQ